MKKYSIPTAKFHISSDMKDAKDFIEQAKLPIVLKADGLAAGKEFLFVMTIKKSMMH